MIICTTDAVPGKTISQSLGLVTGNAVKARHVGSDIIASLKGIVGGEIKQYTKLMNDTRDMALERMKENALAMGANAIVGLRFVTSEIAQGSSELCAYGTAVVID